jgi:hypothetical protein
MDASRKRFATPPLWHIEAVGGVHIIKAIVYCNGYDGGLFILEYSP